MQIKEKPNISSGDEVNLLHSLLVILKHKKMIVCVTLAFAVITAVISLMMTPIYKADTKILPPQASGSSISSQVLSQLGDSSGVIGSSLGIENPNDLYIGMLKSRVIYNYIINRFELMALYKAEYVEDAREILAGSVTIASNKKDKIISVSVEDKDPKRAAEMANAFIEKLKEMTQTFAVTEASKRRLFFEEQLKKVKEDLLKSEETMQGLQETTGAVSMDDQAKVVIESIAELRAQIAAKEVEIKVLKTYTEPKNPDLQKTQDALKGMKEQLQKLETKSGETPDPLMSTGRMPAIGTDYVRKLRDVKYQETLLDLMAKQYEIARVDEARDATVIQVLDKATPPARKAKPSRTIMVIMATIIGLFLSTLTAFFIEHMERIADDEENKKMIELLRTYSFFNWGNRNH
jgi:tyrosine-protein kinase Etk/Wzc